MKTDHNRARHFQKSAEKGFTLMELLAVVALFGIIAIIAFPSFESIIQDKRKLQGESLLLGLLQKQEHYFSNNDTYTTNLADLDYDGSAASVENREYYTASAGACPGSSIVQCVRLVATPLVNDDLFLSVTSVSDTLEESSTAF